MRMFYMMAAVLCAVTAYRSYAEGNSTAGLLCAIAFGINLSNALKE